LENYHGMFYEIDVNRAYPFQFGIYVGFNARNNYLTTSSRTAKSGPQTALLFSI